MGAYVILALTVLWVAYSKDKQEQGGNETKGKGT